MAGGRVRRGPPPSPPGPPPPPPRPWRRRLLRSTRSTAPPPPPPPPPSTGYRRRYLPVFLLLLLFLCLLAAFYFVPRSPSGVPSLPELHTFEVVNEYPHDPRAFTQGLVYGGDDVLYESTGLYGESTVRQVHLHSGKVQSSHKMNSSYFGEGLTLLGERLFQVTWMKDTGFMYARGNLSKLGMFTHQMKDGWGLTTDGKVIFGSDGTSILYQIDPETLKVIKEMAVRFKGYDVYRLNELEYVNGEVWANVWMSDCIARISPGDGRVLGWILLRSLREGILSSGNTDIDCLNGIAWDGAKNRLFVTGKLWPKLYEIKLRPFRGNLQRSIESTCFSTY